MQGTHKTGLTASEAAKRLTEHGPNKLGEVRRVSPLVILLRQFTGLLVLILIAAAAIALALGEAIDAIAIGLVVLLNGVLGFVQEWRAETAIDALRSMLATHARVIRDGVETEIDTREIVPGDVVLLSAGDKVPADMVLTDAVELRVEESALTGESLPVTKTPDDPEARLFMGTAVVSGHAEGEVTATGTATKFGEIATLTTEVGEKTTHLQRVLAGLARQLALAALGLAALVAAAGLYTGHGLHEMFMMALSLAVAIVPEGLPAVVTITLALGASAMVRQQALARRLQAVETLGAASVICTDKTGTLTEDKMTATRIWTAGADYTVTGGGYDPAGHIETADGARVRAGDDRDLCDLLSAALLCNRAKLTREGDDWVTVGSPTEAALMTLAYKGWCPLPEGDPVVAELPFSSERKRMSVVTAGDRDGEDWVLHVKGAPERIVERSTRYREAGEDREMNPDSRARIVAAYEAVAAEGARVIALARRVQPDATAPRDEDDLTFLGFVGLMDPPRPEVKGAIAAAKGAGIRVIMITGDGAETARAVAGMVGLEVDTVLTGRDVEEMADDALDAALRGNVLFARTEPVHKMRIVRMLQGQGQIVAMTGDGVNDAPALKKADIGVAMGIRGSQVAREAADMILKDDAFSSIVVAVEEGRVIFNNIRKFVVYLLSANTSEILTVFIASLLNWPLPLLPLQILFLNIVTDAFPALALGVGQGGQGIMKQPPRDPKESILTRRHWWAVFGYGLLITTAVLGSFWIAQAVLHADETETVTISFLTLALAQLWHIFNMRDAGSRPIRNEIVANPYVWTALAFCTLLLLGAVYLPGVSMALKLQGPGFRGWITVLGMSLTPLVVGQIIKAFSGKRS